MLGRGKLSGLHCGDSYSESAQHVLHARLQDLIERRSRVTGLENSDELHDLRISAKRLRYCLEMFSAAFPDESVQEYADQVREMQDLLGRIHDLDVLQSMLIEHLSALEADCREQAISIVVGATNIDWDANVVPLIQSEAETNARLGVYRVLSAKASERREQYAQFATLWSKWESGGFLDTMRTFLNGHA